jgi:hypothetical protein
MADPVGGSYLGLDRGEFGRRFSASRQANPCGDRAPCVPGNLLASTGVGIAHHSLGALPPATAEHIISQVGRVLDATVAAENRKTRTMGKLGAIAERIAEKKKAHDKKADEWASRLDKIDNLEVSAFQVGDAVVDEREADLRDFESDMRQLSNLPFADSRMSASDSGKATDGKPTEAKPLANGDAKPVM